MDALVVAVARVFFRIILDYKSAIVFYFFNLPDGIYFIALKKNIEGFFVPIKEWILDLKRNKKQL